MKYIEAIYDCDTDTETFVEREYMPEQIAEQNKLAEQKNNLEAKAAEKAALLEKLGITADEAKLLLS